jgi:hypothetical protein
MHLPQMLRAATIASIALAFATAAHAVPTSATYTINLPDYAVTNIIVYNLGSPFATVEQGSPENRLTAGTPGPTTIVNTYLTAADVGISGFVYVPGKTFLLGVTSDLPGDAPGQQHLVIFMNDAFAQSAKDIAFGTLFPNTNETTLINDLVTTENVGDIFDFASGPNGSIYFTPGDTFTAVAFSDGRIIGTGTSSFVTADAPEPLTLSLFGAGLAGLGAVRRRRKAA